MSDRTLNGLTERLNLACHGLSRARIGALTDTHPETVRRYLKKGHVTARFLSRLCAELELSAEWLLNGIGPMQRSQAKVACLLEASPQEIYDALGQSLDQVLGTARGRIERFRPGADRVGPSTNGEAPDSHANGDGR